MPLPRVRFTVRRMIIAVAVAGTMLTLWRAYRQIIPVGIDVIPYWIASVPGPRLTSPDGSRVVQVVYYEAEAVQSGHYRTWLIQ